MPMVRLPNVPRPVVFVAAGLWVGLVLAGAWTAQQKGFWWSAAGTMFSTAAGIALAVTGVTGAVRVWQVVSLRTRCARAIFTMIRNVDRDLALLHRQVLTPFRQATYALQLVAPVDLVALQEVPRSGHAQELLSLVEAGLLNTYGWPLTARTPSQLQSWDQGNLHHRLRIQQAAECEPSWEATMFVLDAVVHFKDVGRSKLLPRRRRSSRGA